MTESKASQHNIVGDHPLSCAYHGVIRIFSFSENFVYVPNLASSYDHYFAFLIFSKEVSSVKYEQTLRLYFINIFKVEYVVQTWTV